MTTTLLLLVLLYVTTGIVVAGAVGLAAWRGHEPSWLKIVIVACWPILAVVAVWIVMTLP